MGVFFAHAEQPPRTEAANDEEQRDGQRAKDAKHDNSYYEACSSLHTLLPSGATT